MCRQTREHEAALVSHVRGQYRIAITVSFLLGRVAGLVAMMSTVLGNVLRTRLLDQLDGPGLAPITLITAPAGYGKSTVAHQWVTHHPERASGWYQIRTEHNSLSTFLQNLWRTIDAATGRSEDPSGEYSIDLVLERLRQAPGPTVVVLDDYHLIENEQIHRVVEILLRDLPDSTHIVILSRQLPEFSLARLRAYGQVRQLTQDDLAFTFDEVKHVFAGSGISDELLLRLTQRSEGWIAGLQLTLMSVNLNGDRASEQLDRLISAMSENRLLNEYIVEEVLDSLPEDLRRFVLDTVLLDELDPELCNAVLRIEDSDRYLKRLEHAVVFVGRPGGVGHPLAFHRLFAECVQRLRLRAGISPCAAELRLRAARWYRARDDFEEAAEYALAAEAWDEAAELIVTFIPLDFAYINVWDSFYWVGRLPESALRKHMPLLQSYISILLGIGRVDEARPLLEEVFRAQEFEPTPRQQGWQANQHAYLAFVDGDRSEALYQSYRALALLPWDDASGRLLAWSGIHREAYARGERDLARAALRQAKADHKRQPRESIYWHFLIEPDLTNDVALRGDLIGAEKLNRHFIKTLPPHMQISPGAFNLRLLCIYLEQNRLDLAALEVDAILADLQERKYLIWLSGAMVAVANYYLATGDPERAWHMLEQSAQVTRQFGGRELIRKAETGIVNYWMQTGQDELAQFWADSTPLPPHVIRAFGDVDPHVLRAQLLLRQNRHAAASELLTQALAIARSCGNVWAELSLTVWAAAAAQTAGARDEADAYLKHALELGAPGRFVRIFSSTDVDLRDSIRALLPELSDEARGHARSLVGEQETPEPSAKAAAWIGLTLREGEVLTELVAGKSNREIADTLYISERTVKKHLANLFRKSGASNRTAVALWGRDQLAGVPSAPRRGSERTGAYNRRSLQIGSAPAGQ